MRSIYRWTVNRKSVVCITGCVCIIFTIYMYHTSSDAIQSHTWKRVKEWFNEEDARYHQRKVTLLNACRGNAEKYKGQSDISHRLVVDHKHQLIFCPIAKVASTFWGRVMQVSSRAANQTGLNPFDIYKPDHKFLEKLKTHPFNTAYQLLNQYTKFLFVREPYSRLLACYIDKFFTTNTVYWNTGRRIIRHHRQNPTAMALACGHDVTFSEFIKHVIATLEHNPESADGHWMPMYVNCAPCEIEYDIIGKLETITSDLDYIVGKYMSNDILFGDIDNESQIDAIIHNTNGLYRRYTPDAQKCMSLPETLLRFLRKLQARGTISKSVELPERFKIEANISRDDVETFILEKYREDGDKIQRKRNRKEALVEAYSQVPMADMIKLQQLYKPDFHIFGYDPQPVELFNDNLKHGTAPKFYFPF